jgi:hypothetical protein
MIRARINGIDCILFYDERVPLEKAPLGYPYMYHIRHDEDDWTRPISIEQFVVANFFGTIFMKKPVELGRDGYMEIERFWTDCNYVKFKIKGTLFSEMLGL